MERRGAHGPCYRLALSLEPKAHSLAAVRACRPAPAPQGPVLFRRAAFVPPGYASLLFAHLYERASCRQSTSLFRGFREFMLEPFGLGGAAPAGAASAPLAVRLVSRRPGRARRRMARQIANEEEVLGMLQEVGGAGWHAPPAVSFSGQRRALSQQGARGGRGGAGSSCTLQPGGR